MNTNITIRKIEKCSFSDHAYLVRGVGKRAIKVVLRAFKCFDIVVRDVQNIVLGAALFGARTHTKTVWVEADSKNGQCLLFNQHQMFSGSWYDGIFLQIPDSTFENCLNFVGDENLHHIKVADYLL